MLRLLRLVYSLVLLKVSKKEQVKQKVREKISEHLAKSGGLSMKVGQVIADVGHNEAFTQLLKGIPQRKLKDMVNQFSDKPNHPNMNDFKSIEESAVAASLGQVHRGVLQSGELVAIKIQYPEIEKTIKSEIRLANLIPSMGPAKKWRMDMSGYKETLEHNLLDELDYSAEAKRQIGFKKKLDVEGLCIPAVFESMTNKHVLVQSWEEGVYFDEVLNWEYKDRAMIARTLLMTLWQSIFVLGEVHGDPHMGNCYYRKKENSKPEMVLLDFGCTVKVTEVQRMSLLKMILALREGTEISTIACFSAMGFDIEKLGRIEHELLALTRVLLKPFLVDQPFDVSTWNIGRGFELILQDRKWWFRSAGPSKLFLLMRAFQGVSNQLEQLKVNLSWWTLMTKAIGETGLEKAREFVLPTMKEYKRYPELKPMASALCVKISQGDDVIMNITLPPDAALDMRSLMPDAVLTSLNINEWDNEELQKKLITTRLAPQELYRKKIDSKEYNIWLA